METIYPVTGVRLSSVQAGIKHNDRNDLVLIELPASANVAATFTKNQFCAAPVQIAKQHLSQLMPRYLLINTGYANAGTGNGGMQDALSVCAELAQLTSVSSHAILPFSTGVIGERMPVGKIKAALPALIGALNDDTWALASRGIMTTDTRPKCRSISFTVNGESVVITGISKGAGMIEPNMATMLGFFATNARIEPTLLHRLHVGAIDKSFNCITIDGDTSTNDAAVLIASGAGPEITESSPQYAEFVAALETLYRDLAQDIVRDGEGATKFITVQVNHGASREACARIAKTVANSPLVKTAFFASDPNWGRILAAVGRAGVTELDMERVNIWLGDVQIVAHGGLAMDYTEAAGAAVMAETDITVTIDLGLGEESATVWTCDFSYDYVKINAEYRS